MIVPPVCSRRALHRAQRPATRPSQVLHATEAHRCPHSWKGWGLPRLLIRIDRIDFLRSGETYGAAHAEHLAHAREALPASRLLGGRRHLGFFNPLFSLVQRIIVQLLAFLGGQVRFPVGQVPLRKLWVKGFLFIRILFPTGL